MTSQEANSIPLGDYPPITVTSRPDGTAAMTCTVPLPFRYFPSFKVFREENRWYDFGDGYVWQGGGSGHAWENCSFPQAMKELGRMRTSPQLSMPSIRKPETVSGRLPAAALMTVLKVIPVQNRHLLDYAASRGIDGEIVRKYCVEVHYCFERNPREKYALGFANDHRVSNCGTACSRCAYAKDITCISEGNRSCAVFEGFLTFSVSSSTQGSIRRCPHLESWTCVLNSTAIVDRSKDFLSKYEKVHAFLDNDAPGRGALGKIRSFLPEDVILVNESERLYPRCNDFNEFLQKTGCPAAGHEI